MATRTVQLRPRPPCEGPHLGRILRRSMVKSPLASEGPSTSAVELTSARPPRFVGAFLDGAATHEVRSSSGRASGGCIVGTIQRRRHLGSLGHICVRVVPDVTRPFWPRTSGTVTIDNLICGVWRANFGPHQFSALIMRFLHQFACGRC
jgi:hypothetical protein